MTPSSVWNGREQQHIPLSVSKHMYQTTWCHNLEDPIFSLYVVFVKTTEDMFWNSCGKHR